MSAERNSPSGAFADVQPMLWFGTTTVVVPGQRGMLNPDINGALFDEDPFGDRLRPVCVARQLLTELHIWHGRVSPDVDTMTMTYSVVGAPALGSFGNRQPLARDIGFTATVAGNVRSAVVRFNDPTGALVGFDRGFSCGVRLDAGPAGTPPEDIRATLRFCPLASPPLPDPKVLPPLPPLPPGP